ncbi:Uu.00g144490.m01.CDS01 [Anthostomella pinea]|uniref:lytic cellulose monooxygenase (C4-dehydrogenating) n=1 Tax=Anthostomella pinea TaxID=933095 RepID=A0AAI8YLN0_9PEZI|nr:Uu.00g144490.m01.CDS01 [Anthostomella pinea]
MASKLSIAALAATVPLVHSHFTFIRLALNDEWQAPTRYIRNKTSPFEDVNHVGRISSTRYNVYPTYWDDYDESVRCGRDHMAHAADTEVLTLSAGDTITVAHTRYDPTAYTDDQWTNCPDDRGSCDPARADRVMDFNHRGPIITHLSQVPDGEDVRTYDGAGDWVKIHRIGFDLSGVAAAPIHWLPYNDDQLPARYIFQIPPQIPAGQYLLRFDLVNTGTHGVYANNETWTDPAQLYATCAQIQVESAASGALPAGIGIPEAMSPDSPGMTTSTDMYQLLTVDEDYVYPGGLLWDGENMVVDKPDV